LQIAGDDIYEEGNRPYNYNSYIRNLENL
jgi:hypothetical protein